MYSLSQHRSNPSNCNPTRRQFSSAFHLHSSHQPIHYTVENLRLVLETFCPTPKGVLVGGGVSVAAHHGVNAIVKELNESKREGERLHFICIPVGIKEKLGAEGLIVWLREALSEEFGIAW